MPATGTNKFTNGSSLSIFLRPAELDDMIRLLKQVFLHMKPSTALATLRAAMRQAAGQFRAANLRVFGSAAKGDDHDDSDLDLLVDPLPGATLLDLGGLQITLEEMLGVSVDLVTPGDLPPKFRRTVLAEAIPI